jgi:23S rRNA pseudouridine1911/1915/1917 synthase
MKRVVLIVGAEQAGRRLDRFLSDAHPERSRSEVQREVRAGNVSVSGGVARLPSRRLRANEEVVWDIADRPPLTPEPIPLDIRYEDDHLIVVDKPTGLVVHPGAGTDSPTLVEGLLADRSLPQSDDPTRPGIVHRLDKDTSGVIVVAKTSAALAHLQHQFAVRSVSKFYIAVVDGVIKEDEGTIEAPIGRDPASPRRMSIRSDGRAARTDFRVLRRLDGTSLLLAHPRTGRTHQLRVHLRYIAHPVLGDSIYGTAGSRDRVEAANDTPGRSLRRQAQAGDTIYGSSGSREQRKQHTSSQGDPCSEGAGGRTRMLLHAWRIVFQHPETGEILRFEAPVPLEFPSYPYDELPWSGNPDPD